MKINKVCIIGGTGFVGHHLIPKLANAGIACRIPARRPHRYRSLEVQHGCELTPLGDDTESLKSHFSGCDAVINLLGILNESRSCSFEEIHVEAPKMILEAAMQSDVKRLLHMSALNADEADGASNYLKSKGKGENLMHTLNTDSIKVTSFQPSVIFGDNDSFINRFAQLLMIPGPLPLACADAKFSPVYVGDVTTAFLKALTDESTFGKSYELCGPRTMTLLEIVQYIAQLKGIDKSIIGLGGVMSRLQARILGMMPGKPFTMDNYNSLQQPSVCTHNGLQQLGIKATDMDAVVPQMLS